MDAIEFLKKNHVAFDGQNEDAKFWVVPDPEVAQVYLVFFYLPTVKEVGAELVYLKDRDFENVEVFDAVRKYGPWELRDLIGDTEGVVEYE